MSFFRRALAVYAAWVAATYLLEGLPRTLLQPEAAGLRLSYALVANLGLGILLPLWMIRAALRGGWGAPGDYGFSGPVRSGASLAASALGGYALFRASHPQPTDPVLLVNVFAQAWVVSAAEIMVCWALVGTTLRVALRSWSRPGAALVSAAVASLLFGAYHFAHSPPFNEVRMVIFLTAIGFVTSLWWLVSRDVCGTALFHNFFALTGVLAALRSAGSVAEHPQLSIPLIVMALVAGALIAWPAFTLGWRAARAP